VDAIVPWLQLSAEGPWLYVVVILLVIADAFLVVLPSETVVVALGSLAFSTGAPNIAGLLAVAAVGAIIGDNLCYLIGRSIGTDRFRWMRRPRIHAAFGYARRALTRRPASVILTARYIPFARIAVNLTAGATGFSYRTYLPLTLIAGTSWAVYNCFIGALFGTWLAAYPVVAVIVSVVVAISLGVAIDVLVGRFSRRGNTDNGQDDGVDPSAA
jgi:membrane-associated protein